MTKINFVPQKVWCLRCGHEWIPRGRYVVEGRVDIKTCPKCRSPYWDRAKTKKSEQIKRR